MDQNLINYIKQCREQNISDEQIRTALLGAGWKKEDINNGLGANHPIPNINSVSTGKLLPAGKILSEAFKIYIKKFVMFTAIALAPAIIVFLIGLAYGASGVSVVGLLLSGFSGISAFKIIIFALLSILAVLVVGTIQIWSGASLIYAAKDYGENISIIEAYKRGWKKIISYWGVSVLMGFIIFGGFAFFIIPGIYFAIWFCLAGYILIAEDIKGMNALLKSKYYIAKRGGKVYWRFLFISVVFSLALAVVAILDKYVLSGIGLSLIATIIDKIISLCAIPLTTIYTFLVYNDLKALRRDTEFVPTKKAKAKIIVIAILGILMIATIVTVSIIKSNKRNSYLPPYIHYR